MDILLTIIAVVIIFSILVLAHEWGHFMMARRAGIKVLEFGIGFPPRLFKKKIGETVYSINAIPIGGFVRLFGEDSTSEEVLKNRRSFAHKNPWTRTKVVIAGVIMNFILAITLLTIGFSFGIEPLLVTEQDLFTNIEAGSVQSAPGIYVASVQDKAKTLGIKAGDRIFSINDQAITDPSQLAVFEKGKATKDVDVTVAGQNTRKIHIPLIGEDHSLGIDLKPFTQFPHPIVLEVKKGGATEKAGIKKGDAILQMNSKNIYSPADVNDVLNETSNVKFTVLRGNQTLQIPVVFPDARRVVVADVFRDTSAEKAGLIKNDVIVNMNGVSITSPEQVQEILKKNPQKEIPYKLNRNGKQIEIKVRTDKNNFLGIALSQISSFQNTELSLYRGTVITSITEIRKVRYWPHIALRKAISESVRLTGITIAAFGRTISSIFAHFKVPGEIGGPVQIAYYTHTFIQEGFFALLRFTALLSLSLAVINILPIPALDGGRLLFIVIEVIFKKRVNARFESFVHGLGFVLLLGLIILVTYSDIVKLF